MVVIAFVAVLVFGPDKLPELMRQAGAMLRQLRHFATNARDEIRDELGPAYADLELRDLDPREIVRRQLADAMADEPEPEQRPGQLPLAAGETPPYDLDAT
ncbi:Sec-independent protein translocase subunit TatB [Nocardioides panacisoli]|nr:Sec-independent protein translocase subunit TatB [Nocardioides panacisoli]